MTGLDFLYHTLPGRFLLKGLTMPQLSKACGRFLDEEASAFLIPLFVKKTGIDVSEYDTKNIHSFNDFFSRKILEGRRPVDLDPTHLIAPCDGLLSVWPITKEGIFPVKQSAYTVSSLLRDEKLARRYEGGNCFVFRLCVNHYHRYCYADSGKKSGNRKISGVLHTVRPIALREVPVFTENSREYTCIHTTHFGTLLQMEVGAMLVGRIVNYKEAGEAARGEEKGMFQYGGSTIILLTEKGTVQVRKDLLINSADGTETAVRMGEMIGYERKN